MEINYIPDFFIGKSKVSLDEQNILTEYLKNDCGGCVGKSTKSSYDSGHDLYITSPSHSDSDDNIDYAKYDKIFRKYIYDFIKSITDKKFDIDLAYYVNIYAKNQFAIPHYDGDDFTMIYYGKSNKDNPPTSLALNDKWVKLSQKFEKIPNVGESAFRYYGNSGEILFFPANVLHWVDPNKSNEERIVIVCGIRIY